MEKICHDLHFHIFTYLNGYHLLNYFTINKKFYKLLYETKCQIDENIQFKINILKLKKNDYKHIKKYKHLLKNVRILACNNKIMEMIGPSVRILDISWNYNLDKKYKSTVTDKGFSYLKKIHILNMSRCKQETITDVAFKNLLKIVNYNF